MRSFLMCCVVVACVCIASGASAQLIISEVYEANGGTVKFVEIHNQGLASVDLAAGLYALQRYSNGGATPTTISLTGTVAAGDFFVIGDPAVETIWPVGTLDQSSTSINHNGDDTYQLVTNPGASEVVVDSFAGDNNLTAVAFATNVVAFRVGAQLPNNGAWGDTNQPADGATSTSGYWVVYNITAGNANALTVATPGTDGGGGGVEVPVELMSVSVD